MESWQRFTLLDLLLLQASFGLGLALACSPGTGEPSGVERMIAGAVLGSVFAGPIILMTQWTVRDRSRPLTAGEWLWLSPSVLFFILWCSLKLSPLFDSQSSEHLFGFWIFAQITCSEYLFNFWIFAQVACIGASVATLFSGFRGYRSTVPCYWTDRMGGWASLFFGIWVFVAVLPGVLAG